MVAVKQTILLLVGGFLGVNSYLVPFPSYVIQRAQELQARKVALTTQQAHADLVAEGGPDLSDVRLAGWRVTKGSIDEVEEKLQEEREQKMADSGLPAEAGDVVEYTIPERLRDENDGRVKGVGILLSSNRDRVDVKNLAENLLDLCQVGVLTIDVEAKGTGEGGEKRSVWMKDELEPHIFVSYGELKKVAASCNWKQDKWRRWELLEELSEGCGAAPGAEEELNIL